MTALVGTMMVVLVAHAVLGDLLISSLTRRASVAAVLTQRTVANMLTVDGAPCQQASVTSKTHPGCRKLLRHIFICFTKHVSVYKWLHSRMRAIADTNLDLS